MKKVIFLILILLSTDIWAQRRSTPRVPKMPTTQSPEGGYALTYDISASSGSYNEANYTEINLGLNWRFSDWWVWRNAAFHRFGSGVDSVTGIDTSLRLGSEVTTDGGGLGVNFYVGPGLRFASPNSNNAAFGEAGLGFRLGGLYIGVGGKSLYYLQAREDSLGRALSKNDTQVFIVLAGGGAL